MATTGLSLSLLCLAAIRVVKAGEPPPPTIGDILLEPYMQEDNLQGFYQPLIYYTDGIGRPDYGAMCSNSNSGEGVGTVLCRQLGYAFVESQYKPTGSPVWFKDIQCEDTNASHILRCQTTPASGGERHSTNVCGSSNQRLLIKCDFKKPLVPYDGQVALCHSDSAHNNDTNKNKTSTSFGVIGIYYKDYDTWRGVNQKDGQPSLEGNEADAICRQMGFTEAYPGTVSTINTSGYTFDNCFSNVSDDLPFILREGAWMTTDDVKNNGSQRCFGCYYNYPQRGACQECDVTNNIVIRCTFDPSKIRTSDGKAGSQRDCELNSRKQVTQCESADPPPTQNTQGLYNTITSLRVALGFMLVLLFILGPFGLIYLICLYKKTLHSRVIHRVKHATSEKSRTCCCQFDVDYDDENKYLSEPT